MADSRYKNALKALSARTGAPLPSLLLSFGILHEVTAIVPLIAVFYGSRSLGVGEGIINTVLPKDTHNPGTSPPTWTTGVLQDWVTEGEVWAMRVGRRYGVFGFEKNAQGANEEMPSELSPRLAGDVANAIVAYGVTKALVPVRIGLSLYFSPAFSRRIIEPVRISVLRCFGNKS